MYSSIMREQQHVSRSSAKVVQHQLTGAAAVAWLGALIVGQSSDILYLWCTADLWRGAVSSGAAVWTGYPLCL